MILEDVQSGNNPENNQEPLTISESHRNHTERKKSIFYQGYRPNFQKTKATIYI